MKDLRSPITQEQCLLACGEVTDRYRPRIIGLDLLGKECRGGSQTKGGDDTVIGVMDIREEL